MPTPTYVALQAIQQSPGVRRKLDEVADRIATRVAFIAAHDHLSAETDVVHQSSGTRPRGRSYSRVGITHRRASQGQNEIAQALGLPGRAVSGARNPRASRR